jgi:hypothetical protein
VSGIKVFRDIIVIRVVILARVIGVIRVLRDMIVIRVIMLAMVTVINPNNG